MENAHYSAGKIISMWRVLTFRKCVRNRSFSLLSLTFIRKALVTERVDFACNDKAVGPDFN